MSRGGDMATSLIEIRDYFGYATSKEFRTDWVQLTDEDKHQIRDGFDNGTMTY
jgi:hypothetical protein